MIFNSFSGEHLEHFMAKQKTFSQNVVLKSYFVNEETRKMFIFKLIFQNFLSLIFREIKILGLYYYYYFHFTS